jgi:phage terminase small subunit
VGLFCPDFLKKFSRKGVGTMAISISKLKKQLMSRIDTNDLVQVEKVERYIDLVKSFRKISKTISKEGESVTTVNGSQKFTKAHPLIGERNKINAQIIALGKDLGLDSRPKNTTDDQGGYSASDLV